MAHPIYPCIWFDNQAQEAAQLYTSIFKNSKILETSPIVSSIEINGSKIMLLNGGPKFKPDEAFSLVVNCDTQDEIDFYWDKLIADGGQESMCGWLKDKYGISWQIVPVILEQLMTDPKKSERVVQAFLKMKKFNIQALLDA
jgi:predicted 3-demethylubiquinone-9 3-methyltransferase (glyoxalase superfamily)